MIVELIFVVRKCLFANFPVGITMQDSGKRERSNGLTTSTRISISYISKMTVIMM